MSSYRFIRVWITPLFVIAALLSPVVYAGRPGWKKQKVDWRIAGGSKIKAIHYPKDTPVPTLAKKPKPSKPKKKTIAPERIALFEPETYDLTQPIIANVIDSPPIDGFVPWVAIAVTDARSYIDLDSDAYPETSVTGSYLPQGDYTIGIFDTGASASVISDDDTVLTGMYDAGLITSSEITLIGATGDINAFASHPLGIFMDGLGAVDQNTLLVDDSNMLGESNVSLIVGDPVESPNLPTVIGAPMAVFCAASFRNDRQITLTRDSNDFNAPDTHFYPLDDPDIPDYTYKIYLELRHSNVGYVQYFPCIEIPGFLECPDGDGSPLLPTIIVDGWWLYQGLFFVSSVDLTNNGESSIDKDGFMYDTGAQVTVVSEAIGARLQLNPASPDFEVVIQGVTGDKITAPGFYIDSLEIVATPEWLAFTNVPVIILDIDSPEGGLLDGIIGMNLFVDLKFVFHGGGLTLLGQDHPFIKFQPICHLTGDIAPDGGDCVVDYYDLDELIAHWLDTSSSPSWNPDVDLAPQHAPDEKIDILDYDVLSDHWLETITP